jgi:hypothetical protein
MDSAVGAETGKSTELVVGIRTTDDVIFTLKSKNNYYYVLVYLLPQSHTELSSLYEDRQAL